MINRELIRIKVVQLVYAYLQNKDDDQADKSVKKINAEKELLFSLSKAYDLYNLLLSLIVAVSKEEYRRYEILTQRAIREGHPRPSSKFVYNKFAQQLEDNEELKAFQASGKASWDNNVELVRKLCGMIESSEAYAEYLNSEESSYEEDRELWRKIYRQIIQNNEDIDEALEEKSLYWNDDKDIVDTFVIKTIKKFEESEGPYQQLLPDFKNDEDRQFAIRLFHATIEGEEQFKEYISAASLNWDIQRLAYMDTVILLIAIAEMLTFNNIPVNVTISEYVELAKLYSTPRSAGYINGVLDNIAHFLVDKGLMLKSVN